MNINYNHYRTFYYVAKYQNITQAATILLTSQSNITRAIKLMESALGCNLFVRSNRGVQLTPEGEKLYSYVRVAIEQLQAGEEELLAEKSMQSGTVSIGTSGLALRCFLLPVLNEFRRKYPNLRLRLANHSTPQAIAALKSGAVEIAMVTTPLGDTKSLVGRAVKKINTVAVGGSAYADLSKKPIDLKTLAKHPIVSVGAHTANYELYVQWFMKHGLQFSPEIEAYTSDQVLPFVRSNLGIGFVPDDLLEEENSENLYRLQLKDPIPARSICFLKKKDQNLSIAARKLEEMIISAAEK